jgi:hypothetical protein
MSLEFITSLLVMYARARIFGWRIVVTIFTDMCPSVCCLAQLFCIATLCTFAAFASNARF